MSKTFGPSELFGRADSHAHGAFSPNGLLKAIEV